MRGGEYEEREEREERICNYVSSLIKVEYSDIKVRVDNSHIYIGNIENNIIRDNINKYEYIIIYDRKDVYAYKMNNEFKEAIISYISSYNRINIQAVIRDCFSSVYNISYITEIILGGDITSGGKKAVVKYTVKDLQAIAIENKIKITKKVEGKTVRLNKQGMIAKLKRYKLI